MDKSVFIPTPCNVTPLWSKLERTWNLPTVSYNVSTVTAELPALLHWCPSRTTTWTISRMDLNENLSTEINKLHKCVKPRIFSLRGHRGCSKHMIPNRASAKQLYSIPQRHNHNREPTSYGQQSSCYQSDVWCDSVEHGKIIYLTYVFKVRRILDTDHFLHIDIRTGTTAAEWTRWTLSN